MRIRPILIAGALALFAMPALAAGWPAWSAAFPSLPCSDGWAGCMVGGSHIGPGMVKDAAGRPIPADARVGWFDLQATGSLSPFVGLSAYTGALGGEVAVVEAPPAPPVEAPPVEQPRVEAPPAMEQPRVESPRVETPPSVATRPTTATTPPPSTPPMAPTAKTTTAPPPVAPTAVPPPSTAKTTGATAPVSAPTTAPTATTAKTTAPPPVAPTTAPTATTAKTTAPAVVPPPTAAAVGDDSCNDLVKLEPQAMLGQLRPGQAKCIEGRIGTEGAQTMKDKLSRVLIANAEGKGDKAEWERLVKRHLEDIDRSDPDMCFKYATQLSRGGVGRATGVIRWADYALENKQKWSGATYTKRVYDLYRMKAEAANKLWADAEETFATKEHTDENEAKAAKWRGTTKDFAREWLDYAKASGQDTKNAMAICVSAAGNKSFCEG